ncbi:MAG TPA: rhomboid family intramembrane serine protease [Gemmata sp.]|nr:rhomboid family intramembrane serine protease [Gemmata sp.]
MDTGDELISPPSSDATPLPIEVGEIVLSCTQPTPTAILGWIAKAAGQSWFPSQHAATTGTDRDALDEPLTQLRIAGLVRIATWVRGIGQGYTLTPEGEEALATGLGIPTSGQSPEPLKSGPVLAIPDDPMVLPEEQSTPQLPIDPRPPVVVPTLLIANVLWFFVGLVAAIRVPVSFWTYLVTGNASISHRLGSVGGEDLLRGEWWRLLASCFVHGSGIHLLVNLFALAMVGPLAELLWGRRRLLAIYVLSGLAGSCLAMAVHPQHAVVGASGAIWGVLMSLVVWFVVFRSELPSDVVMDAARRLTVAIGVNVGLSFLPGISWESHLGGGVVGLVAAGLLNAMRFGDHNRQRIALGLLFALPVMSIGGLMVVMGRGENWTEYRRQVAQEKAQQAAKVASKSFDEDIRPILDQLNPESVAPVQRAAVMQLFFHPGSRQKALLVAETQAKLTEMKSQANRAIELLSSPPVGVESFDQFRARAKEFAEARARSFDLLLDTLATETIPNEAASTNWGNANRSANALWEQIRQK